MNRVQISVKWGVVIAMVTALTSIGSWQPASAAPAVGQCRTLTASDLNSWSNDTEVVNCANSHTAHTYAVVPVDSTLKKWSDSKKQTRGTNKCAARLDEALGTDWKTRMMTAYSFVFFYPTKAQMQDGEFWVRCDLILRRGSGLSDLPKQTLPAIGDSSVGTKIKLCATKNATATTCDAAKKWRAKKVLRIAAKSAPSPAKMKTIAEKRCPKVVGNKRFLYVFRSAEWSAGNQYFTCLKKL